MSLELDDAQVAIRALAADVFGREVTAERIASAQAGAERFDRRLWSALAAAGLIGVAVPEELGGLGLGAVELALVLEEFGRAVAPVPLLPATLAAWLVAAHGDDRQRQRLLPALLDGSSVLAVAPVVSSGEVRVREGRLSGAVVGVPWAHVADAVAVVADGGVWLVDPAGPGVDAVREETTAQEIALSFELDDCAAEPIGDRDTADCLRLRSLAALAAVQSGVTEAALRLTAAYTSTREQFGKPLSTFQGVALKAADAYVDAIAIRATALQAAWTLDRGDDAVAEVLTAAWWAAEAGQHCVHITQHLHGGMGADVSYPVHRFFLWGKQIELMLGGASALLAELGDALDARPDAGDAVVVP
jgi:3-oxocholest-4-en-26-oyl-CoA dehydrogenase beta subunit